MSETRRAPPTSAVENDVRCRCAMHTLLPPGRPAAFFMRGVRKEFNFFRRDVFRFALLRALVVGEKEGDRGESTTSRGTWMAENHPKHGICRRIARLAGGFLFAHEIGVASNLVGGP